MEKKQLILILKSFFFVLFFGFGSLFPLLSVYLQKEVHLTGSQIGIIMATGPIVMMLTQPFWGMVTDYFQRPKFILMLTMAMTGLFSLGYIVTDKFWLIFCLTIGLSLFQGAIIPIADSLTLTYMEILSYNYGSIRLYGALGFAFGVLVTGMLADVLSTIFIFYSFCFMLFVSILLIAFVQEEKVTIQSNILKEMKHLFQNKQMVLFFIACFLVFGPIYANDFYFGMYIHLLGGTLTGIGVAFFLAAGSEAPFMKYSELWMHKVGAIPLFMIASVVAISRWMLYIIEPPLLIVYISTIMQGVATGLTIPSALYFIRKETPKQIQSTAISVYYAISTGLGAFFCTLLGGFILEYFSMFTMYFVFALLTFLGILTMILIVSSFKRSNVS